MWAPSRRTVAALLVLVAACQPPPGDTEQPTPVASAEGSTTVANAPVDELVADAAPAAAPAAAPDDSYRELFRKIKAIKDTHGGGPPIWYETRPPQGEFGAWPMSAPMRDLMQAIGRPSELELREYSLPLNNPAVVSAAEATHMRDDDNVVAVLVDGRARAYPWWIITNYHVVNDTIGSTAVYVVMCEVCSGAGHFDPVLDGWSLDLRVCGAKNGTFFVCDFQTKSAWTSFSGAAFAGPLQGRRLPRRPIYQTTWKEWRTLHPETEVVFMSPEVRERPHGKSHYMGKPVIDDQLQYSVWNKDPRLPDNELVYGLMPRPGGDAARVYTLRGLQDAGGILQASWLDTPIVFVVGGGFRVGCFVRRLGDVTLELSVLGREPLRLRDQLGNVWDEWGQAVEGGAAGARLSFADGYLTEWYEWINHYPKSDILPAPGSGQKALK